MRRDPADGRGGDGHRGAAGPASEPAPSRADLRTVGRVHGEFSARQLALAGLLRCCEPPVAGAVTRFVEALGPDEAWKAISRRQAPADVTAAVGPRLGTLDQGALNARAADDLRRAAGAGAEIVGPGDAAWPEDCLAGLDDLVPYDKCPASARPLALYRRGGGWPLRPRGSVAVVGSRSATPYGVRVAMEMGAALVGQGVTVVSGAAFGVDAAAHRGALHGGGSTATPPCPGGVTVAVLACGIDRSYPAAHRSLLDATAACGSVVSEYPPGSVPARHRFLVRNRLIAAFAEATVVVEAGRRSGSLNTATSAGDLGRQVLAVPGPVSSAMSVGCHDVIRDHKASLVTDARDVIGLLGPLQPAEAVHRRGDRPTDGLDLLSARVHDALPARGGATADEISAEAGLPVADVLGALATLQIDDLVRRADGRWRRT